LPCSGSLVKNLTVEWEENVMSSVSGITGFVSFAMTFDVLDGTTQTSDLQSALSLAATIDPTPITQSAPPVVFTQPVV